METASLDSWQTMKFALNLGNANFGDVKFVVNLKQLHLHVGVTLPHAMSKCAYNKCLEGMKQLNQSN